MQKRKSKNGRKSIIESENSFNYKNLLVKTILTLVGFVGTFILINILFKEYLFAISKEFVEIFGAFGISFGFFITSAFLIPWPDDAISSFGMIGGIDFLKVVGLAALGSILGSIVAYNLGALLKHTKFYNRLMKHYRQDTERLINLHGVKALALATLTPLPDSIFYWISGALGFPFGKFILTILVCRPIKITYVLLLIRAGLLSFQ